MALIAERWGLIPELRSFTAAEKPVWGTCAGLIFLADRATGVLPTRPRVFAVPARRNADCPLVNHEDAAGSPDSHQDVFAVTQWPDLSRGISSGCTPSNHMASVLQARRRAGRRCWAAWTAGCSATSSALRSTPSKRTFPCHRHYERAVAAATGLRRGSASRRRTRPCSSGRRASWRPARTSKCCQVLLRCGTADLPCPCVAAPFSSDLYTTKPAVSAVHGCRS